MQIAQNFHPYAAMPRVCRRCRENRLARATAQVEKNASCSPTKNRRETFRFVSFRFISFRFVSFRSSVCFRLVWWVRLVGLLFAGSIVADFFLRFDFIGMAVCVAVHFIRFIFVSVRFAGEFQTFRRRRQ